MWILTAVGPVHGLRSELRSSCTAHTTGFTHVLEQNKSYKLGRDKGHDIVFDSKSVRPTEGTLQVGDWNPSKVSFVCPVPPQAHSSAHNCTDTCLEARAEEERERLLPRTGAHAPRRDRLPRC